MVAIGSTQCIVIVDLELSKYWCLNSKCNLNVVECSQQQICCRDYKHSQVLQTPSAENQAELCSQESQVAWSQIKHTDENRRAKSDLCLGGISVQLRLASACGSDFSLCSPFSLLLVVRSHLLTPRLLPAGCEGASLKKMDKWCRMGNADTFYLLFW